MIAHRVLLAAGILAAVMLGSLPAIAADWRPFTQAEFSAAQKDGKPILVDIFAPWCPTCRAQKPILEELTAKAGSRISSCWWSISTIKRMTCVRSKPSSRAP